MLGSGCDSIYHGLFCTRERRKQINYRWPVDCVASCAGDKKMSDELLSDCCGAAPDPRFSVIDGEGVCGACKEMCCFTGGEE